MAKALFRSFAGDYRQLSAEDRQAFVELGASGTIAHRAGKLSFGVLAKSVSQAMSRKTQRPMNAWSDYISDPNRRPPDTKTGKRS